MRVGDLGMRQAPGVRWEVEQQFDVGSIKTNPWSFWVPTELGCVQNQGGSLFLYMRYITLTCGPVLWSESELFTLIRLPCPPQIVYIVSR